MEILIQHNILKTNIRIHLDNLLVNRFRLRREKGFEKLLFVNFFYRGKVNSIMKFKDSLYRELSCVFGFDFDDKVIIYYPERIGEELYIKKLNLLNRRS